MSKRPQKDNPDKALDWEGFYEELQSESQRGGILVGSAFLDEHLRQLIKAFLVDDSAADDLLERSLRSFSARIEAAYSLGLISPDVREDLNIIREIRNEFAHSLHGLSFEHEWVINKCKELKTPKKLEKRSDTPQNASPGSLLLLTIAQLGTTIRLNALHAERERLQVGKNWDFSGGTKIEQEDKPT